MVVDGRSGQFSALGSFKGLTPSEKTEVCTLTIECFNNIGIHICIHIVDCL